MKTFEIQITETLQRVVKVEADSEEEAYKIINRKYRNEEIVLDSSDFYDKEIKFFKRLEDSDFKESIRKLIEYLWDDEERHYEELEKPKEHIFNTIFKIKTYYLD